MQRWVEREYDLSDKKYKHMFYEEAEKLAINDLEVGFAICLVSLGFSSLVFCCEVIPTLITYFKGRMASYLAGKRVKNLK